jgi:biotin transporter BioY
VITSASGGYIVGFVLAAALTGFLAERRWDRRLSSSIGLMLTGNVVIYLVGLPWLAVVLNTNLEKTLEYGLYPFIPGDTFKLYLAAACRCLEARRTRTEPHRTLITGMAGPRRLRCGRPGTGGGNNQPSLDGGAALQGVLRRCRQ